MNRFKRIAPALIAVAAGLAACTTTTGTLIDPDNDPREGLTPGLFDAGEAIANLSLDHTVRPPEGFFDEEQMSSFERLIAYRQAVEAGEEVEGPPPSFTFVNSDLAFDGDRVVMGNYHGINIYDVSNGAPELEFSLVCPGGQGDITLHGDLLFMSVEEFRSRTDCGQERATGQSNPDRFRGIRVFDISDLNDVRQVGAIQTCRGSHTHTLVPHPSDDGVVYLYNQGTGPVRAGTELGGCQGGQPDENQDTSLYSIDIIKVDLGAPETARIIDSPRIFADRDTGAINGLWTGGPAREGAQTTNVTNHCHDITVYPELNLAAGACSGNGILLDISDPENPQRIDEVFDENMAYWHSATFSNDGSKIVFTDEWGGGVGARCTPDDPETWGANIFFERTEDGLVKKGFFKIPGSQTDKENCVAHNGSLIPVPGRDIMVQAWYSGGLSVIDWTDIDNPIEIAYFDRGPLSLDETFLGGYWSAYWHNGKIYGSEIVRGLDVLSLTPSPYLTEAEIAAAELIHGDVANVQTQTKVTWPDEAVVAEAYLDQLTRSASIDEALARRARGEIGRWDRGAPRSAQLDELAYAFETAATDASDVDAERMLNIAGMMRRVAG